jgi:hypothetical protein
LGDGSCFAIRDRTLILLMVHQLVCCCPLGDNGLMMRSLSFNPSSLFRCPGETLNIWCTLLVLHEELGLVLAGVQFVKLMKVMNDRVVIILRADNNSRGRRIHAFHPDSFPRGDNANLHHHLLDPAVLQWCQLECVRPGDFARQNLNEENAQSICVL